MRGWVMAVAAAALAVPAAAPAAKSSRPQQRPEAFEALVRCRALGDDAARLRCFDAAAATLQQQAENRDLVMVDRKTIQETKRGLFGLDIPNLNPFGGGGDDGVEEIKSIDSTVRSATRDETGHWIVTLEDNSIWAQTDNYPFAVDPRRGNKVKIVKAAMGSYMMRVNGQPGVRAKRRI
ncbi:MAG: hypothetical protein QOJ27_331 [Sphingomonadales bacterium]|nr:hypothetical protein [Sphingomonadales bacterium]